MKIYLAGCKGIWRMKFRDALPGVEFIDPFKDSNQRSLATFTIDDLKAVEEADMIVVYIGYPVYTGACIETGYAHALGRPIWLIWELRKGRMEPMLFGIAKKIFSDVDTAIERLKKEVC